MDQILRDLNERAAAKGSLVVTNDGMVVAGSVREELHNEIVGALSSFLISATYRCLRQGNVGELTRMVMTATHGKIVIQSLADYFLVVIADQFSDTDRAIEAVRVAGEQLRKMTSIEI